MSVEVTDDSRSSELLAIAAATLGTVGLPVSTLAVVSATASEPFELGEPREIF